jgi:UDP-N-acetyl-D-glucosamine dehydrogenase
MNELAAVAVEKFRSHRARIGVLGLGYAGLPLACCFAEAGFTTYGFDIDPAKVRELRAGRSYIGHISPLRVEALVGTGKLVPTCDFSQLAACDAAIICVPTPLGEGRVPDLSYVTDTARRVAEQLHRGQLVVLESTTYPGTTDEVLRMIFGEHGMEPGRDYFLAFSPEREDPANAKFNTASIPKVVGGVTNDCVTVASAAYAEVIKRIVPVSSARVAEATKLLENIYRCVNIAMVNELKILFQRMDIDLWEVIAAAATKPFGFNPFYPGPRARRPLYPDRSVLSDLEGAPVRDVDPVYRAGGRNQRRDAAVRAGAAGAGAQPCREAIEGRRRSTRRRRL